MKNILAKEDGSSKKSIPVITVPTAPIPVHTAYPVPKGITCVALLSNNKLSVMQIKKPTLHFKSVKFWDNLRQVVNPTSNKPAHTSMIQEREEFKMYVLIVGMFHRRQAFQIFVRPKFP